MILCSYCSTNSLFQERINGILWSCNHVLCDVEYQKVHPQLSFIAVTVLFPFLLNKLGSKYEALGARRTNKKIQALVKQAFLESKVWPAHATSQMGFCILFTFFNASPFIHFRFQLVCTSDPFQETSPHIYAE